MRRPSLVLSVLAVAFGLGAPATAQADPPANASVPAISGSARESQVLSSTTGEWTGTAPLSFRRGWQRCDRDGLNCAALGATGENYMAVAQDVGSTLRVKVEARNAEGVAYALSAPTGVVSGNPPNNTAAPVVSGNTRSGQLLSAKPGTWAGTQPFAFEYAWRRCDGEGAACVSIPGAAAQTYRLTDADIGVRVRVQVTATNAAGTGEGNSAPTAVVGPAEPPVVVREPSLTGELRDSQVLRVDDGEWTGATGITFKYSWWRCDALEAGCAPISGAAAKSYTLSPADVDRRIKVIVTASNSDGSATATTPATGLVAVNPPANLSPPAVSGATRTGQVLSVKLGSWSGTPTLAYVYQWLRCDANGAGCQPIEGETANVYTQTDADLGVKLAVRVTAGNPAGTATKDSTATPAATTPAQPPVNTALPTVTGVFRDGETLTSATGTWTGMSTITYARRWQRCDADGAGCAPIPGATANTYRLTPADTGRTVRVEIVATNPDGVRSAQSEAGAVAAAPPVNTRAPVFTGSAIDGVTLKVSTGSWTGTPDLQYAFTWERCDASAAGCVAIAGADAASYTIGAADIGSRLRARVTVSNQAGTVSALTATGSLVEAAPPAISVMPSVDGIARDAQVLTGSRGAWTGTDPISYNWQWRRCSATGGSCQNIPGADGETYRLTPADVKFSIRLRIEATNRRSTTAVESAPTAVVQAAKPAVVVAPELSGAARDGETLTTTLGTWTGTPTIAYTYQWEHCPLPGACEPIPGATSASYTLTSADLGTPVRARITATNAGGSSAAASGSTEPVDTVAPASTALPAVTGPVRDGGELTVTPGTWTGTVPQARSYRWRRCDATGESCGDIAGATASAYRLTAEDVGATLRVEVTSANAAGSASATSERTPLVAPDPPANQVVPVVTGEPRDGRTLSADHGAWRGTPTLRYAYRWQRCAGPLDKPDCTDVDGAASATYTLRTADAGYRMRLVLTAANGGGAASVTTGATGVVQPNPPVNAELPRIEGVVRDGEELTATTGAWTGVVSFEYTYQWQRCDPDGNNCGDIAGATLRTYRLTATDVGVTVRVEVIARNAGGATAARSQATTVGTPRPPGPLAVPAITGHTGIGQELTAVDGGWTGSPPLAFTRQWLRCGGVSGGGCTPLEGETGRVYVLTPDDLGHKIRVRVRAANAAGWADAESEPTRLVRDDPPISLELPEITTPSVHAQNVRLTAEDGAWGGGGPLTPSYRWRRCNGAGDACGDIIGATEKTYLPRAEDIGRTLRVTVTMDNGVGAASATSAPSPVLKASPPESLAVPVLKASAGLQPGTELTATQGSWSGSAPLVYAFAWLRCAPDGGGCSPVAGAGGPKYVLSDADLGRSIRVRVSATNPTLTVAAQSEALGVVVPVAPANTAKPIVAVDGGPGNKPRVGVQVRGEGGTWSGTGPLRFTYRWQRCQSASDCQDIPGADAITYTFTEDDVARRVRLLVIGENAGGSASAVSASTDAVAGAAPVVLDRPRATITGAPREGARAVAEPGDWGGTGQKTFSYQWQRCKEGSACRAISGATRPEYTVTTADIGQGLAVMVSARSPYGKTDAVSATTATILAVAPSSVRRPSFTRPPGRLQVGSRFLAEPGQWEGSKPIELTYQWLRCDDRGRRCTDIASATKKDYVLTRADFAAGSLAGSLRVAVTARNAAGAVSATSEPFGEDGAGTRPGTATTPKKPKKPKRTKLKPTAKVPLTASTLRFDKRGRLLARLACAKGSTSCVGQLAVAGPVITRVLTFTLRPGQRRTWVLKLSKGQRKAAGRAKAAKGTLTLTVRGDGAPRSRPIAAKVPKKLVKRFRRGR